MYYIGVDLGTSAVKLVLMQGDGTIKNVISKSYELYFPHPGWSEQNPSDWFEKSMERMKELTIQRTTKQPLEFPSAGSTFKRPEGYFAGKLVMDSGLRGYQVGGARVSEKHCGFVINAGGATAKDVRTLMENVRDIVYKKYGVTLEPEVKFLGEFE